MSSNNAAAGANTQTASTKTFVSALVLNSIVAGAEILVFIFVRRYFPLIYEPRSLSISKARRQKPLSPGLLGWLTAVFNADLDKIKEINGLDCYFFLRFLRMMVRIMLPIWLLSWAVLLPLTSVHTEADGHTGLDKFVFGNIAPNKQGRYAGQLLLTWIFTIWIWYNVRAEMSHYIHVRQEYLVSHGHSSTAQACSILVTGIPPKYLSERSLARLFDHLPGGVRQVWINRDLKDMPDLYYRRLKACDILESAETSLLSMALKRNEKKKKKQQKVVEKAGEKEISSAGDLESPPGALLEELVPRQKWPSHRLPLFSWLPSLPLVGKKVDTIEWAREQVHELTTQLEKRREILASDIARTSAAETQTTIRKHQVGAGKLSIALPSVPVSIPLVGTVAAVDFSEQTYPPANAAFILFNKQIAAHIAANTLTHHDPYCMSTSQKFIEVAPDDVIWDNLAMNNYDRRIRTALSWAATIGIIILWALPVAFVGFLSNIHSVCSTYKWLHWVCKAPGLIIDIVQGFLSTVLIVVLFMLVPIVMRILARFQGIPQKTGVELSLMDRFFMFQVIVGFLVVGISSGIIASLPALKNPSGVPAKLAQNLPKSSTFFLTFVLLQALAGTASGFLQIGSLVMYYVKITLLASTPRSVYNTKYSPRMTEWGTLFPKMTQLVAITFGYSIISPIINGLAFAAFVLFYFLYKYLFTWVNDEHPSSETGGLFFPKAINHIFVGLYVQQLCLCALFFLAENEKSKPSAIPEGALMVVLIVFTAFFHDTIRNSYGPLVQALPLTLADSSYTRVEPEAPATADAPKQIPRSSEDGNGIDYADVSASSHQPVSKAGPPLHDGADGGPPKRERPASSSLLAKLVYGEGPTDFRHPVTVEEQSVIWLPKDPLGLVKEIERDLDSQDILHTTEGAIMDAKGHVDVTLGSEDGKDVLIE